jgi:mRNA-degrading endonuclease toxin of MazEF toxin-antitoxin module
MKGPCAVNLHNIVAVPKRELGQRLATLTPERMEEICTALSFALGCLR